MPERRCCVVDIETFRSAEDCRHCGAPDASHYEDGACEPWGRPCPADVITQFSPIGWNNKAALGLSIGCYWDAADGRCHFFDGHTLADTMRQFVERQPLLVSFNGIAFDFPLMRAILRRRAEDAHSTPLACLCDAFKTLCAASYDLLAEMWRVDPDRRFERGLNSLDAIAQANGLGAKLSHGAQAPRDWQAGRYAQVLNYVSDDVYKTKALFELVCAGQPILRGDGRPITLRHPFPEEG